MVDAYSIWPSGDSYYIGDCTHPNQQGYNALGDFWFNVIQDDIQLPCGGLVIDPGDVNADGSLGLADAINALKVLTDRPAAAVKEADVNGDGKIGFEEALHILQLESFTP